MLKGLIGLIIIPLVSLILLVTVVGLYLGLISLLCYIIMLLLSTIMSSMVIGENIITKLAKKESNPYLAIIIGVTLIKLIGIIPSIGGLIYFFSFIYGFGRLMHLAYTKRK